MAYGAGEYLVNVRGNAGDSEAWSNTWCFNGPGPVLDDVANIADRLNDLYTAWTTFASWLSTGYSHEGATLKVLATGDLIELPWSPASGSSTVELLPTQLAMRISLSALGGVRGGPYIAGFCETANDGSLIDTDCVSDFVGALETFCNGLTTDGLALAINRPSVETTEVVTGGRVGRRWDVIRKRANDTAESFQTFSVSQPVAVFRPGKPRRLLTWTSAPVAAGGLATLTWDASEDDGDWSLSDLTTSVVERPGLYIVTLRLRKATGNGSVQPLIYVNGSPRAGDTGPAAAGVNFGTTTMIDLLELGDAITGRVAGVAAGATFDTGGSGLAVVRIGPLRWTQLRASEGPLRTIWRFDGGTLRTWGHGTTASGLPTGTTRTTAPWKPNG